MLRLFNMTDRSLGKPSNCTVRAEAIPHPGGCWVSYISYRQEPSGVLPSRRFHRRLCLRRLEYAASMENAGKRRATLLRPQITESETGLGTF